jgi:hypothetical protein
MMNTLSAAEVRRHERCSRFSTDTDGKFVAWIHTRGRMGPESEDSGEDLVLMQDASFPERLISGAKGLSRLVFNPHPRSSPSGFFAVVQCDGRLLTFSDDMGSSRNVHTLPKGEKFVGCTTWGRADTVLFATKGPEGRGRLGSGL